MKLPDVPSSRGAPMGRGWPHIGLFAKTVVRMYENDPPKDDHERRHYAVAKAYLAPAGVVDVTITRCNIDSGGYDSGGAYWGTGQPIYWASSECGTVDMYLRAKSARLAKSEVISKFPNARFV